MRCLPVAGAIATVLAALVAPRAHADGTGVIAVSAGAGTGTSAATGAVDRAAIAAALVEAIGARGRVVGDAVAEARAALAAGAVPAASLAQFRRVREQIDDGWRAFLRVQIDAAQAQLAAARASAEALAALPGGLELYADATLRLGAVLHYRRLADAPSLLALALALDPARPITLAEFSPDVVDAVDAARAAPAPAAKLHVTARPAGALLTLDGKELGPAPLDADVPRGPHLLIARAPLHRAAVRALNVDGPASVELALDGDDTATRLATGAELGLAPAAEQALVDDTLALADLDDVVVATVTERRGGPALVVQRCVGPAAANTTGPSPAAAASAASPSPTAAAGAAGTSPVAAASIDGAGPAATSVVGTGSGDTHTSARCTVPAEIGFGDPAGLSAAAREAWQAIQSVTPSVPPGILGETRRPPPPSGCQLCRNPLVWAGVGAAVIGTVIVIAVTSGSKPPPIVTIDGHDFGR